MAKRDRKETPGNPKKEKEMNWHTKQGRANMRKKYPTSLDPMEETNGFK